MNKLLILILAIIFVPAIGASEKETSLAELRKKPGWLFPYQQCPADITPKHETKLSYGPEKCKADMKWCINKCKKDDGNACYALARAVQENKLDNVVSEALYQRSCKLGVTSGCTNRAAGIMKYAGKDKAKQTCAARTFKTACERNDPWACTMNALNIYQGIGVKQNTDLALSTLKKVCTSDPKGAACVGAVNLRNKILQIESNTKIPKK